MLEKNYVFKIDKKIVEVVDWDITIDEMELLKKNVGIVHSIDPELIEVDIVEVEKPILSETTFVTDAGMHYKAPNPYSVYRKVEGLRLSSDIETLRGYNGIEKITEEGLGNLLEKIISGRADDVIIYY